MQPILGVIYVDLLRCICPHLAQCPRRLQPAATEAIWRRDLDPDFGDGRLPTIHPQAHPNEPSDNE